MVFSSQIFLFYFLGIALLVYYAAPRALKNLVLALMSYVFYGWWNPWFTLLLLLSTVIDYGCGRVISRDGATPALRRIALTTSIVTNLGILGVFKYAGFFAASLEPILGAWSGSGSWAEAIGGIALPVGISFYTFQSMSYSIDLYRKDAAPARSFIDFACFVSMFPQLVAGPIVRYGWIADQFRKRTHTLEGFVYGMTRFNLGFAKKILLANPAGEMADLCFAAGDGVLTAPLAWLGVLAFSFQIYFDFSGYSDMAVGLGRMFGFRLPENFNSPYRAWSLTEFWRRWHLTLSSFLRDYLYVPLGGNRRGTGRTAANLMIVMLIGGLWHGASWTFVIWGGLHGLFLMMERAQERRSPYERLPRAFQVALTFLIVSVSWVFFRAEGFSEAGGYLAAMTGFGGDSTLAGLLAGELLRPLNLLLLAASAIIVWGIPNSMRFTERLTPWKAGLGLVLLAVSVAMMFRQGHEPFLYFQF